MRRAVVLFTRDLRIRDHAALDAAVEVADEVVPLFVFDDALRDHRRAPARQAFLLESLHDLRSALRRRGGELFIRHGDPVAETMRIAHETDASLLFVGADASSYAQRRQDRLARACASGRIELRVENTIAAVPPGELAPAARDHYRVFTPYWRRWRELTLPAPLDAPSRLPAPDGIRAGELRPAAPDGRGGERAAQRRLDAWLRSGLHDYERGRNDLAGDGTSRLSPYLHFGCVSAVDVIAQASRQGPVADPFVRQLCWRDFYLQLLAANPETAAVDLHPREREWEDDDEALAAWAEGRTGFPLVDAAMRQLRAEGWIHNRARLVVGSFLTKTLGIDWRYGADVFFELLLDGDVANNVGNWQWVAGTGVDARPNRSFNPVTQGKRLDPHGEYVRRYLPELAELPGPTVHEPWRAPLASRAPEYSAPIVDPVSPATRRVLVSNARAGRDRLPLR
jgi:deoxyribodipyrimidine photo-lyase